MEINRKSKKDLLDHIGKRKFDHSEMSNNDKYLQGRTKVIGKTYSSDSVDIGTALLYRKEDLKYFPTASVPSFVKVEMDDRIEYGLVFEVSTLEKLIPALAPPVPNEDETFDKEFFGDMDLFTDYVLKFIRIGYRYFTGEIVPQSSGKVWITQKNVLLLEEEELTELVKAFPRYEFLYELLLQNRDIKVLRLLDRIKTILMVIPGFDSRIFQSTTIDVARSIGGIPEQYLKEFIKKICNIPEILGIITESSISKAKCLLFWKDLDIQQNPIVSISDFSGRKFLAVVQDIRDITADLHILWKEEKNEKSPIKEPSLPGCSVPIGSYVRHVADDDFKSYTLATPSKDTAQIPVGNIIGTNVPFLIPLTPERNCNSAIAALSGSGKTNLNKIFVANCAVSNLECNTKIGGLLIDRHYEYMEDFEEIRQKTRLGEYIVCLSPSKDSKGRIPLCWAEIDDLFPSTSDLGLGGLRALMKKYYTKNPDSVPSYGRIRSFKDRLSLDFLNWVYKMTPEQMEAEVEGYNVSSFKTLYRDLKKLRFMNEALQIVYKRKEDCFVDAYAESDLFQIIKEAQEVGRFVILDLAGLEKNAKEFFEKWISKWPRKMREYEWREERETFLNSPVFLIIVEEALETFKDKDIEETLKNYERIATGARKLRMGYLLILQSTYEIKKSLLNQLAFTFVLRTVQDEDRQQIINKFPGTLKPYDNLIAGAEDGVAVASIMDKTKNTSIPVKISYFPLLKRDLLEVFSNKN